MYCRRDGGKGSGYFGHAGRPGQVGGSKSSKGIISSKKSELLSYLSEEENENAGNGGNSNTATRGKGETGGKRVTNNPKESVAERTEKTVKTPVKANLVYNSSMKSSMPSYRDALNSFTKGGVRFKTVFEYLKKTGWLQGNSTRYLGSILRSSGVRDSVKKAYYDAALSFQNKDANLNMSAFSANENIVYSSSRERSNIIYHEYTHALLEGNGRRTVGEIMDEYLYGDADYERIEKEHFKKLFYDFLDNASDSMKRLPIKSSLAKFVSETSVSNGVTSENGRAIVADIVSGLFPQNADIVSLVCNGHCPEYFLEDESRRYSEFAAEYFQLRLDASMGLHQETHNILRVMKKLMPYLYTKTEEKYNEIFGSDEE